MKKSITDTGSMLSMYRDQFRWHRTTRHRDRFGSSSPNVCQAIFFTLLSVSSVTHPPPFFFPSFSIVLGPCLYQRTSAKLSSHLYTSTSPVRINLLGSRFCFICLRSPGQSCRSVLLLPWTRRTRAESFAKRCCQTSRRRRTNSLLPTSSKFAEDYTPR